MCACVRECVRACVHVRALFVVPRVRERDSMRFDACLCEGLETRLSILKAGSLGSRTNLLAAVAAHAALCESTPVHAEACAIKGLVG